MRLYTFHIIWLLLTLAAFCAVLGGPIWGYPIAMFLAFVFSIIVAGYPSDNSLRRMLGVAGVLFVAGGLTGLVLNGLTPITRQGSLPLLLFGSACIWSAIFPSLERSAMPQTIRPISRKFPSDGPPCPKCSMPLRTPKSLQCFHCGADWH